MWHCAWANKKKHGKPKTWETRIGWGVRSVVCSFIVFHFFAFALSSAISRSKRNGHPDNRRLQLLCTSPFPPHLVRFACPTALLEPTIEVAAQHLICTYTAPFSRYLSRTAQQLIYAISLKFSLQSFLRRSIVYILDSRVRLEMEGAAWYVFLV